MKYFKNILVCTTLLLSFSVKAELSWGVITDSRAFEPAIGCAAGGLIGVAGGGDSAMKNAAINCVIAGGLVYLLSAHYFHKYGKEQRIELDSKKQKLRRRKMQLLKSKEKRNSTNYKVIQEKIPGQIINGKYIGPRVKEYLQLKDPSDRLGM
jgi:hypothetical protein